MDLANTYLFVRANVNNWLHSLFKQVDVYLNDTLVTPSTNTCPYRAYIETALSYGSDAKETQLTSQLWYKDTAGRTDSVALADDDTTNAGFKSRRNYTTPRGRHITISTATISVCTEGLSGPVS